MTRVTAAPLLVCWITWYPVAAGGFENVECTLWFQLLRPVFVDGQEHRAWPLASPAPLFTALVLALMGITTLSSETFLLIWILLESHEPEHGRFWKEAWRKPLAIQPPFLDPVVPKQEPQPSVVATRPIFPEPLWTAYPTALMMN